MANYLVRLDVQIGEYEKTIKTLVEAKNRKDAGKMALALECHGNATFDDEHPDERVWDLGGEMAYTVSGIEVIPDKDLPVVKKHFNLYHFDQNQIDELVNG
jgi:hypothetical protein